MPCFLTGSEIIRCDPYSWCVRTGRLNDVCSFCFKQKQHCEPCSKCSLIKYCNKKCQENDYVNHRLECVIVASSKLSLDSLTRFCIRTLTRKKWESSMCQVSRGRVFGRKFSDLLAPLWQSDCDRRLGNSKQIYELLKTRMEITFKDVLICLLKLHVHSVPVEDYRGLSVGRAIYLDQSVFEHSCEWQSTVSVYFDGKTFVMRALRNFRVCSLSRVRIAFVSTSMPAQMRREILARDYYVQCECALCVEQLRRQPSTESTVERMIRETLSAKGFSTRKKLRLMLTVLAKCNSTVHPYYLSNIYRSVAISCNSLQRYDDAVCYASKALAYEQDARFRTAILEELLFAMIELGWNDVKRSQFPLFFSSLQSCKQLLEIRLGKEHKETEKLQKLYMLYRTQAFVHNSISSMHDTLCRTFRSISGRLRLVANVALKGKHGLVEQPAD